MWYNATNMFAPWVQVAVCVVHLSILSAWKKICAQ